MSSKQGNRLYRTVQPPASEEDCFFGDNHQPGQANQSLFSFGKVKSGTLEAETSIRSRTRGCFFGNNRSSGQAIYFVTSFGSDQKRELDASALPSLTETVDRFFGAEKQTPSSWESQDGKATPVVFLPVILSELDYSFENAGGPASVCSFGCKWELERKHRRLCSTTPMTKCPTHTDGIDLPRSLRSSRRADT
jgi:hypothetical protein